MKIKDLSEKTELQDKTIRFYEEVGVLPAPRRLPNNYRSYDDSDVARVQFVVGARRLGFSLDDIREIVEMRDRQEPPCRFVLDVLNTRCDEITGRIVELRHLETELRSLLALGRSFPSDDVDGKECVCHLVKDHAAWDAV